MNTHIHIQTHIHRESAKERKKTNILSGFGALVNFTSLLLALPVEVIKTIPTTLPVKLNIISLRLQFISSPLIIHQIFSKYIHTTDAIQSTYHGCKYRWRRDKSNPSSSGSSVGFYYSDKGLVFSVTGLFISALVLGLMYHVPSFIQSSISIFFSILWDFMKKWPIIS